MSTVTVTPSVEPSEGGDPPRIRLNVTDTGTPAINSVTVTRLDPDGRTHPVRTPTGGPLPLSTSGSNRVGVVYDYEAPLGQPVSYSTLENPARVSVPVTITDERVWLIHPGVPSLSMPVELRAGSLDEETLPVRQGVHVVMGRRYPVVQTDGQRKAEQSSLTVAIDTLDDLRALKALVDDAGTLLFNAPAADGLGVPPCYIAVGDVQVRRVSNIGGDPYRAVTLPFQVVDRPAGGSQAERNYADILAEHASYGAVMVAYDSYMDVLTGP